MTGRGAAKVSLPLLLAAFAYGCNSKAEPNAAAEAPPPVQVIDEPDADMVAVAHPEQFPLVAASLVDGGPSLTANGSVSADVARQVPVVSLASGRVVEIHARLGDSVKKGQLLIRIQSADISAAFAEYEKGVVDERLAQSQLDRSRDLKEKGAISQKDLDVAQSNQEDAKVTVQNAAEHLRVLGADVDRPGGIIDIRAPVAGVITEQNVTASGAVKTLDNSPNLFTVSDLSQVWIVCDVYENDLPQVHLGQFGDIHLAAYPNAILKGRVSDISPVLDPANRAAKVRLQVANPGFLRLGMFVTATFHGRRKQARPAVPASAVLHLHDRDWVYVPAGKARYRRVGVEGGIMLAGNRQEIDSGLQPGQQVVANALVLQNTVEQ